jgi:hypothetical protein
MMPSTSGGGGGGAQGDFDSQYHQMAEENFTTLLQGTNDTVRQRAESPRTPACFGQANRAPPAAPSHVAAQLNSPSLTFCMRHVLCLNRMFAAARHGLQRPRRAADLGTLTRTWY